MGDSLSRDAFREQWLKHGGSDDEPPRRLPFPCGSCGVHRWAEVTCVRCGYGTPAAWDEEDDFEVARIFSESERQESKW